MARRIAIPILLFALGQPSFPARKTPIYVTFSHHVDNGRTDVTSTQPTRTSEAMRWLVSTYEKHGIKAQFGFVGMVTQQLEDDYPDVVAAIRRLKMPVGYHGGGTDVEPCQVGRAVMLPSKGPGDLETRRKNLQILWDFETRTLAPNWRIENGVMVYGNPRQGQVMTIDELPQYNLPQREGWLYGGWMAIQKTLGIIPMDTDAAGGSLLYEKLGVRSFPYSWGPLDIKQAISLPGMSEPQIFTGPTRWPYKHYGKPFGEDVPRHPTARAWLEALAGGLPDDRPYLQKIFSHALAFFGENRKTWEDLIVFFKSRPDDFRIVWPDWEEAQWKPEHSPEAFYRRAYGKSLAEARVMPAPVEELMKDTRPVRALEREAPAPAPPSASSLGGRPRRTAPLVLGRTAVQEIATAMVSHYPTPTHDGDYGGPLKCVRLPDNRQVSLADAFQALARSVVRWGLDLRLPETVSLPPIRGPIDYPMYKLGGEPRFDAAKIRAGYMPRELPHELFPPPEIVQAQGLPMQAINHMCFPIRALVNGDDVLHAAWLAVRAMDEKLQVPGMIPLYMPRHEFFQPAPRARYVRMAVNPAEFLLPLAQVFTSIHRLSPALSRNIPPAIIIGMKVINEQRAMLVAPYSPMVKDGAMHIESLKYEAFIWREQVDPGLIDAAWNYLP